MKDVPNSSELFCETAGDIFPWLRENFSWLLPYFYCKILNSENSICWNCGEHENLNI